MFSYVFVLNEASLVSKFLKIISNLALNSYHALLNCALLFSTILSYTYIVLYPIMRCYTVHSTIMHCYILVYAIILYCSPSFHVTICSDSYGNRTHSGDF
jgi:hypothetical protein